MHARSVCDTIEAMLSGSQARPGAGRTGLARHSGRAWSAGGHRWSGVYRTVQMGRRREGCVFSLCP